MIGLMISLNVWYKCSNIFLVSSRTRTFLLRDSLSLFNPRLVTFIKIAPFFLNFSILVGKTYNNSQLSLAIGMTYRTSAGLSSRIKAYMASLKGEIFKL